MASTIGISAYDMQATDLVDLARAADEAGFDALWLGEHVLLPVGFETGHPTKKEAGVQHHFLAIARSNPNAPAAASGIVSAGMLAGAVVGPLVFGFIARSDYAVAWLTAVSSTMVAVAGTIAGRVLVRRELLARGSHLVVETA